MKKYLLLIFILPLFFLTGCGKYRNVYDYSQQMGEIANKYKTLGISAEHISPFGITMISYIEKDGKSKETSLYSGKDNRRLYELCKNNECLEYIEGNQYVHTRRIHRHLLENQQDYRNMLQGYRKVHWGESVKETDNRKIGRMTKKNGIECRLIISVPCNKSAFECYLNPVKKSETCVNEEYGIIVHEKVWGRLPYEFNVKNIYTDDIKDSDFDLPPGMIIRR